MGEVIDVVGCLVVRDNHILLGRRVDTGQWCDPGGKVEAGETQNEAARRELWEEAGLVADGPLVPAGSKACGRYHVHFFLVPNWVGEPVNMEPHKCLGWRWWPVDEPPPAAETVPGDVDMLRKLPRFLAGELAGVGDD